MKNDTISSQSQWRHNWHKLQGSSKDHIIITSWPKNGLFKNWEYTVLSRVRSLEGLYLLQPIDLQTSFKPTEELKAYLKRAKRKEAKFITARKKNIHEYYNQDSN